MSMRDPSVKQANEESAKGWRSAELWPSFLVAGAALILCAATLVRYPPVWSDEVQCTDVSVNYAFLEGWTSYAHPYGRAGGFWTGNPLYAFCLAGWLRVFGFGIFVNRLFDVALLCIVAAGLLLGCKRHGLIRSRMGFFVLTMLVFWGDGFLIPCRMHRYDMSGVAVMAWMFAAASLRRRVWRVGMLGVLTALLPFAGVTVSLFAGLAGVVWLVARKARPWREVAGMAVGGLLGVCLYYAMSLRGDGMVAFQDRVCLSVAGDVWSRLRGSWRGIPYAASAVGAAVAMLGVYVLGRPVDVRCLRSVVWGGASVAGIPVVMAIAGAYSSMYVWMVCLPVYVAAAAFVDGLPETRLKAWACVLLAMSVLKGLPIMTVKAVAEWEGRNYAPIEEFVAGHVVAADVVMAAPQAYYAVKLRVARVYVTHGLDSMDDAQCQSVKKLVLSNLQVREGDAERIMARLKGEWAHRADFVSRRSGLAVRMGRDAVANAIYSLSVYERVADSSGRPPLEGRSRERDGRGPGPR